MKRQALWMVGLVLLAGLTALGQGQEDITGLLLPQEVLRETFSDDNWVLATVSTLTQLPPGGVGSATGIYESPARKLNLVMIDFDKPENGNGFVGILLEALKPDFKADAADVLEQVNVEGRDNLADLALFLQFKDGQNRIYFLRGTLLIYLESDLPVETMVQLTQVYVDFLAASGR